MRKFIRHPTDIPVVCTFQKNHFCVRNLLVDVSAGGMRFFSDFPLPPGELINLSIYIEQPIFEASCVVKWCKKVNHGFQIGVSMQVSEQIFNFRMVEQVCQIEQYRLTEKQQKGRTMTSEMAAFEWIDKFAGRF